MEQAFDELEQKPKRKKCKAMDGLIEGGKRSHQEDGVPEVKDAALIGAAQRVERYGIAAYGTARSLADTLSLPQIAELLQQTLDEEETPTKL